MPVFSTNWQQHPPGHLAVGARADHQHRRLGLLDRLDRLRAPPWARPRGGARGWRAIGAAVGLLVGDVLGKFEMGRAGLFLLGEAERFAHAARDIVGAGQLVGIFGDRPHHRDHVEDLEAALLAIS